MTKVCYRMQTGEQFLLEVVKTPAAKIYRNMTTHVANVVGLDQEDPTKIAITFLSKEEKDTWLGYIQELHRDGKGAQDLTEVEVVISLSKQLLACGLEKPYLKAQGFYGEYKHKAVDPSAPKAPRQPKTAKVVKVVDQDGFLGAIKAALDASGNFGQTMITADNSMEMVYGNIIYWIKPRVRGKIKGKEIEEVELPPEEVEA